MRKQISISRATTTLGGIALLALAIVAAPLVSGTPPPALAADPATNEHVISVSGMGKVTVNPDVADVSLGVQNQRESAKAARDDAAQTMNANLAALKGPGTPEGETRTSRLSIS